MSEQAQRPEMPPQYDPSEVEMHWAAAWLEQGIYRADATSGKTPYCIVIPPPNVTGRLHMGHAFQDTIQDLLIRRARMQGYEALWLPGMDHAGIATQVLVERELRKEGIDRKELGRDAFIERVWVWKESYGGQIVDQIKRLGCSCDWSRERFTMDEGLSRAVREAFVRWYDEGLIYRGERLVNWCPTDQTGLSDSEVEHEDVEGELITFRYELVDGSGSIDVVTTRVETMLGDTGVAVNPDDERYRELVGKTVRHPFDGRELPIVADAVVDRDFGTGAVKITPAHDPVDFEIAQRAGLPLMNIFGPDATINERAPEEFYGINRYDARAAVREELEKLDAIVREERPYVHSVGHCYRCHSEIEPWISGLQWFVAVERLKEPAREVALDDRLTFWPGRWSKPYVAWMENLRDWNISRQLWWGHRIPAWYCPDGHVTVAREDPPACATCGSTELEQDPDVLDTWFSSQLWPFSTLGWPDDTEDLRTFYPNTVLVTGYEILYLWVARMVMSGLSFMGEVPFHHAVIHGLVRDPHGRKLSKSLGNSPDPMELVERFGADALRFSLTRAATGGQQDIPLSVESIEGGRNFANKIWNAARLVVRAHEGGAPELPPPERWTHVDRWLLSRHASLTGEVSAALDRYLFADAAQALYRFLWSEFCDWGLEMQKGRLDGPDDADRADAGAVLAWVFERTLRMLHPTMPFITEEIWQRFAQEPGSVSLAAWPEPVATHADALAERSFGTVQAVITAVRQFRSRHRIPPSTRFEAVAGVPDEAIEAVEALADRVARLAGVEPVRVVGVATERTSAWTVVAFDEGWVAVPPGLFDEEAERSRVRRERDDASTQLERSRAKLANEGFRAKAAPEVVEQERERVERLTQQLAELETQLDELG